MIDRLNRAVHLSLLSGLSIGAALLVLGATLALTRQESHPENGPVSVAAIISRATGGDGIAILDAGILILMLTPVSRVIVLAIGWLIERQWRLGIIALCVLALLLTSLILGTG